MSPRSGRVSRTARSRSRSRRRRAVVAGIETVAEQAGRGPQLEQPGALAAGDLERAPELRLDLVGGGAERGQELGPAAAGLRRPGADVAVKAEGPVGGDQAGPGVAGDHTGLQEHPRDHGAHAGGVVVLVGTAGGSPDAVHAGRRVTVEHLDVPGQGVGDDPAPPGQVVRPGGQLGDVGPDRRRVAQLQGQDGPEHQRGLAVVRLPALGRPGQGGGPGAGRRLRAAEEAEGVAEAAGGQDLGGRAEAGQPVRPALGPELVDGRLEVPPGGLELAFPEGDQPEHVVALDGAQLVSPARTAGPEPLADPARALEVPLGQPGHRRRPQQRRRRLDPELAGQLQGPPLHLAQPLRGVPVDDAERSLEAGQEGQLALPVGPGTGAGRRSSRRARSSRRTASS